MKKLVVASVLAISVAGVSSGAQAEKPSCNWGQLTAEAIANGFPQGDHSSDPSGDGKGPEDRVGLPNVVEKGNLNATCELIASLLP